MRSKSFHSEQMSDCLKLYLFCLKTGSCETTSGQRISFSSFSLANDVPLWYAYSGVFGFKLGFGFVFFVVVVYWGMGF